jgi:hypothetical protein
MCYATNFERFGQRSYSRDPPRRDAPSLPQNRHRKNSLRDTLRVYQTLFNDHLESVHAAPATIKAHSLAVSQLGEYLRQEKLPTDPRKLKREHLTGWMLHFQRAPEDGGTG